MINGRLGTIEVLRLLVALHRARTEPDHRPLGVADREHDAVSEGVVAAAVLFVDEPHFEELGLVVALVGKDRLERMPAVGRVAERKARRRLAGDFTRLEVVDRLFRRLKLQRVEVGRRLHEIRK